MSVDLCARSPDVGDAGIFMRFSMNPSVSPARNRANDIGVERQERILQTQFKWLSNRTFRLHEVEGKRGHEMALSIASQQSNAYLTRLSVPAWELTESTESSMSWLVSGLVPNPAVVFVVGAPKSYKSLFVQDLAISLVSETKFLGYFDVMQTGPVIYIQDESTRGALGERFRQISRAHHTHPVVFRHQLRIITNKQYQILDQSRAPVLEHEIRESGAKLVIFDSLSTMHDMDENSAQEMKRIVEYFRGLRDRHDVTVVVVHHTNKQSGSTSSPNSIRGSNSLWAGADARIQLTVTKGYANVTVHGKDYGADQPFSFAPYATTYQYSPEDNYLLEPEDGMNCLGFNVRTSSGTTKSTIVSEEEQPDGYEYVILNTIARLKSPAVKELADATSSHESSVRRATKKLKDLGLISIEKVKESRTSKNRYQLTVKGAGLAKRGKTR